MAAYEEAMEAGATLSGAEHVQLADSLDQLGRKSAAIKQYKIAIEKDPSQAHWNNYLGIALYEQKDMAGAAAAYQRAIAIDPNDAGAHHGLGLAQLKLGLFDDAYKTSEMANYIDTEVVQEYSAKGLEHLENGERDKAFDLLVKAVSLQEDRQTKKNLGMLDLHEKIKNR